jgi:uncharacterized protein (DUF1778 family)
MRVTERSSRLEARVSREAKALCQRAAKLQGRTLTDFVVHSAVEAAQRAIRESEFIELTLSDRMAFVEALMKPAPPNARLRAAARRHAQTVVS